MAQKPALPPNPEVEEVEPEQPSIRKLRKLNPSSLLYHADEAARALLAQHDVRVEYWLRDGTASNLELALIRTVVAWLERAWWFERPVFGSRRGMHEQRRAYERAGLRPIARLESKEGSRVFHFHAR